MEKSDQPLGLIGFLFALAIGFWGHDMVTYYQEGPYSRVAINEESLKEMKAEGLPDTVAGALKSFEVKEFETKRDLKEKLETALSDFSGTKRDEYTKIIISAASAAADKKPGVAATINKQSLKEMKDNGLPDTVAGALKSFEVKEFKTKRDLEAKLETALSDFLVSKKDGHTKIIVNAAAKFPVPTPTVWILTMVAGMVFLADIVCIIWWYAKYIHKIQTTATLLTYFLDFGVCAMFIVAAVGWTTPQVFLSAVLGGSLLLGYRFVNLYYSNEANDTDRRILKAAKNALLVAAGISFASLGLLVVIFPTSQWLQDHAFNPAFLHPGLLIVLSGIVIYLTVKFREKMGISAEIHESAGERYKPMDLYWPSKLAHDVESKHRITDETRQGLDRFRTLFRGEPGELEYDRLQSRVHPEGDLRVQSYILAMPSWSAEEKSKVRTNEVNSKAFMVGVSHWIDDLVDGRSEIEIYNKLKKEQDFGLTIDRAEEIFEWVYKSTIVNHTNSKFYAKLLEHIRDSAPLADNRRYLFFSLNRVAVGAAIFGPKVKERHRKPLLETHNEVLVRLVKDEQWAAKGEWYPRLLTLLADMRAAPSGLGKVLLGLTTKTVQEMAMASESDDVRFAYSVLYSLLYAPLLYFHDVDGELACSEIVPLKMFDANYDAIFPWLLEIRSLLESKDGPDDPRKDLRLQQLKMAYRCFSPKLPGLVKDALAQVYDPDAQETQVLPLVR